MRSARTLLLGSAMLALACNGSLEKDGRRSKEKPRAKVKRKTAPLVEKAAWAPVDRAGDPLVGHRPDEVKCPRGGWLVEPQGFEIRTMNCNYAMFSQPSLAAIVPGTQIVAMLYHFDLRSAEPSDAHIALIVGDRLIWEETVAIPTKAAVFNVDITADFVAPAGTPVYFHLHNHGGNSWTFASMEVVVEP